jgi:hypothetical protein
MSENPLLDYLLTVLASVMTPALVDPARARTAAQQAIDAYQPKTDHELIATSQILAFALAALEALRLSGPEDVSPSMKLKLRGNANGLNKTARDNARILDAIRETPTPLPAWFAPFTPKANPTAPTTPANSANPANPPIPTDKPDWASAMTRMAEKLSKNPPPPATVQHTVNALWIDTLKTVAQEITPAKNRAALLQTTSLATDPPPERT